MDTSPRTPAVDPGAREPEVAPRAHFTAVPWKNIGLFILISYGLFALIAAPFWFLEGGIAHPLYRLVIGLGMWTPAVASLILAKGVEKVSWRTRVGLHFRGRGRQLLLWAPLAVVIIIAVQTITAVLMILRGVPGDLTGKTWMQMSIDALSKATGTPVGPPIVFLSLLASAVAGVLVTSLLALGEEIGWRGWLWPALRPLGRVGGAIVGGTIWMLWHLPILLIGHNYPGQPRHLAIPMFLLPCIAMTLLFGALTDRASGNPIPAGLAHGATNSLFGPILSIFATTQTLGAMNLFIDTTLGIIGVVALLVAALLVTPRRHRGTEVGGRAMPAPVPAPDGPATMGE